MGTMYTKICVWDNLCKAHHKAAPGKRGDFDMIRYPDEIKATKISLGRQTHTDEHRLKEIFIGREGLSALYGFLVYEMA